MSKFAGFVLLFISTLLILVATASLLLDSTEEELKLKIHYFWGPYPSELKTSEGRILTIPKHVQDCTANSELRRLSQLNLLKINGTCDIQLTEYSKKWTANCPAIDHEKYYCVFLQVFNKPKAVQTERKGDFVEASMGYEEIQGGWTPWIAADRKFFPEASNVQSEADIEKLVNWVNGLTHIYDINLMYKWNGKNRWDNVSSSSIARHAVDSKPFNGVSSLP